MFRALKNELAIIMIGTDSKELWLTRFEEVKYNVLRTQNELGRNYGRYGIRRVTPDSFWDAKYNVLLIQHELGPNYGKIAANPPPLKATIFPQHNRG